MAYSRDNGNYPPSFRLDIETALPSEPKRIAKKPTLTLAGKRAVPSGGVTAQDATERKFSTRAKDAARRDGRTLFSPHTPPAPSTPPAAKTSAATRPTSTPRVRASQTANANATTDRRRLRATEPRRGGKMRDQLPRERAVPAVATAAREPDGTVRVSKLLSEQGLCSRREADSYIARGWVLADGVRVSELGTRVLPTAKLTLDNEAAVMQDMRMTILMNKPVGYVSGQAEDGHQPASVLAVAENQIDTDKLRFHPGHRRGLAPAGRLDIDSTGLLVLTQDGRIAKQLIGENSAVDKEYLVRVEGKLSAADLKLLNHGMSLDGEVLKPAIVKWQNEDQLNFILREGKKRQIRRMCEAVGLVVTGLKRIRIGNIKLGDLPVGKWRFLGDDEMF